MGTRIAFADFSVVRLVRGPRTGSDMAPMAIPLRARGRMTLVAGAAGVLVIASVADVLMKNHSGPGRLIRVRLHYVVNELEGPQ
jgi:hypothetical protein